MRHLRQEGALRVKQRGSWIKRKRREEGRESGGPSQTVWMVTFSDLCTLLLTFFVLLLSMSSLNQRALRIAFNNFTMSSGTLYFNRHEKVHLMEDVAIRELCEGLASVYALDIRDLEEARMDGVESDREYNLLVSSGNTLWVHKSRLADKFSFIFGEKLLFKSGRATLNPQVFPILKMLGDFIASSGYYATVEGHTDDIPIHNEYFSSNEDLSLARAQAVLQFLVEQGTADPRRLAMGGYGSSHPLAENSTPAGREMNRRVEIIFQRSR